MKSEEILSAWFIGLLIFIVSFGAGLKLGQKSCEQIKENVSRYSR
jgi:hypothetical protein